MSEWNLLTLPYYHSAIMRFSLLVVKSKNRIEAYYIYKAFNCRVIILTPSISCFFSFYKWIKNLQPKVYNCQVHTKAGQKKSTNRWFFLTVRTPSLIIWFYRVDHMWNRHKKYNIFSAFDIYGYLKLSFMQESNMHQMPNVRLHFR